MSFKLSQATTAICASMLMLFSTNVKAQTRDRAAFFASPQAIPEQYDKDGLFPTGRSLPFGFYSFGGGTENKRGEIPDMDQRFYDQNQIAAGRYVNMIGPAYELNKFILDDAKRCKIPCIYSVFSSSELETLEVDGEVMSKNTFDAMAKEGREPNWDHVAQVIKDIVAKVADSPWIYAWNVPPEELRSWSKMDMKMLDVATKAIREADPHHRPLLMYLPNHYGAKTMKPFFPSLDIVAKGAYVNYAGQKTSRAWVRWTMEQEQIAYPEGIHFLLPEMFQDAKPEEREMIPAWVRHDVYCGLANGAKGILIFSASRRPNFQCRNLYLNCYLEIAEELNGSRRLGEVYLYGEPRNDLKLDVIAGPATVHVKHFDSQKDYPSLSFLNISQFSRIAALTASR
ncbi:MAG: hypothetical protein J6866_08500, partial [Victivallales bacterium]|nr:hypothetical protein [Victivallales bacterium]